MAISTARRPLPAVVFLLVLSVLTAVVWWRVLHRGDSSDTGSPANATPVASCASAGAKPVTLPAPRTVTVSVQNGAGRDQLATQVSTLLKARGFKTGQPGDAPAPYSGTAEIQYGKAGKAGATLLGYYFPGARLVAESRSDAGLTLIVGAGYKSLATQATVDKAVTAAKKPCG